MADRRNAIGPEPVVEIGWRPMLRHILKIYSEREISDSSSDADTGRRHGRHGKVVSNALSLRTQFAHSTVLDFFFGRSVGKADWENYGAANLCELLMAEIICPTED
jgi:hypothetical protein